MTPEEKLASFDVDIKNIYHELKELKEEFKEFREISIQNAQLAIKNTLLENRMENLETRVSLLEQEPASKFKRYKEIIFGGILTTITGIIIGALLSLIIR